MKRCTNLEPVVDRLLIVMSLLALTLWGVGSQSAIAEEKPWIRCAENAQQIGSEPAPSSTTPSGTTIAKGHGGPVADARQGSPGLRVYIDPLTGEFAVPPPGSDAQASTTSQGAYSTSHEGLVETPSPVPGGGVMVDLQGRFRSPLTATVGADGKIKMRHTPCVEASGR